MQFIHDTGLAGIGARIVRHRTLLELDLLASMVTSPKAALRIATDAGIRAAIFDDDSSRLVFNCFAAIDQLCRFKGNDTEDRQRLFNLICAGLRDAHVVLWVDIDEQADGWDFTRRWKALVLSYRWSPRIIEALFEAYPPGVAAVERNAKRLISLHQRSMDAMKHIRVGHELVDTLERDLAWRI